MHIKRSRWLFVCLVIIIAPACVPIQTTPEIKIIEVTHIIPVTQIIPITKIFRSTQIVTIPAAATEEVPPEITKTPIPPHNLTESRVAYYPLDGDAMDKSGNQFHATVNGATYTSQGIKDGAYEFDGINDYIEVVNIPYKRTGTISVWAFFNEDKRDAGIWSLGDENSDLMILGIRSYNTLTDNISFGALYGQQYYIISEDYPKIQTWHHFVGVWDEANIYFYIDGIYQGSSVNTSTSMIENYDRFNVTRFGMFNYEDTGKHRGMIDEILIYNRPLSAEDVLNLYRSYLD